MKLPGMQWFVEKLMYRMRGLMWGMVASDVETESVLRHAENLSRVEDYARQLEADGKVQQAELLRLQAKRMTSDSPAGMAIEAIADVTEDNLVPLLGGLGPDASENEEDRHEEEESKSPIALPSPPSRSQSQRAKQRKKPAKKNQNEEGAQG